MINHLMNQMMQRMAAQASGTFVARMATISAYDPSNYAVKAVIEPESVETGFVPLLSPWVGPSWGAFFAPILGAQVLLLFQEGSPQVPVAALFAFSMAMPPIAVASGEMLLQHQSGSLLHFDNGGSVTLNSNADLTANVGGNLTATVTGTAVIKAAAIKLQNAGTALLNLLNSAFSVWAAAHVHSNGNGGANTGAPTSTPPAAGQTSVVQAE